MYAAYREEGLNLRIKRPRRRVSAAHRAERTVVTAPNAVWSMDFVSDALFDGRRLRALTLLDVHTREALAIELLFRQGDRASAAARADSFLRRFPESPHAARVGTFTIRGD